MNEPNACDDLALMRRPEVEKVTGLSKPGIYKLIRQGRFPEPVKIGLQAVAWRAADLRRWLQNPTGWRANSQPAPQSEPESA